MKTMNHPIGRQVMEILNDPSLTTKVKRILLRDHLKLSETSVNELCPKDEIGLKIHGCPAAPPTAWAVIPPGKKCPMCGEPT